MPDLDFNCPLNYLLACESFEILKRLVELIDSYFTKFIEEESSINKLKDMDYQVDLMDFDKDTDNLDDGYENEDITWLVISIKK
jgi:hypothetical protein